MNVLRKHGAFVFCFVMSLLSAAPLEAGSVVRLGETVPRAILFGLGLFALWLAIWLVGMRVVVAASARQAMTDPFRQFRAELGDVIKMWALGSCAMILFILFPWVQGFAMPPCSVLAVKLFCLFSVGGGVSVVWTVLRLRKALKAENRAQLTRNEEPHTLRESKGKTASGDLNAPATG